MRFNYKVILNVLSLLILLNGAFMMTCIPFSWYFGGKDMNALLISGVSAMVIGYVVFVITRRNRSKELKKKDGYLIVTLGWLSMSLFGTLPYLLSGAIPSFTDAFFETVSGFTTTGATVLTDIEALDKGILFWRSLTQWIGGMGIIVLAVAILPLLGIGGMQLFVAEAPGISPDKLKPRITETAKRLWFIYVALTLTEMTLLWAGGMTFYDAINHALTTMATGGFSTKNASVAHFNSPFIQYVIIVFMFLAGTNFTVTYFALHGKMKTVFKNEEFRFYVLLTVLVTVLITIGIYQTQGTSIELSIREGLFQVVSIMTTTGYVSADYTQWPYEIVLLLFVLMFVGASAGSTAGGVKIVRHLILVKNSVLELKRQLHPSAILPVRFNGKAVHKDITFNILAFIMIYVSIFALGSILMAFLGLDFMTAISSVATCLGNIGPGLGDVGPVDHFGNIPMVGKWVLCMLMLLGRLELFTVLILFTPYFWRKI
ncbi:MULTISPECIES: TrkH family potassium uptake protein [Reichenbachiella]|uniref:Trk system potassium uptake protein TrkH n=1 Tax=Reichenbachiella agariperforans TaxID=156994 RepID=A0A1M6TK39_REIAG|nr:MULTISPECIES: TrkH family potassium uptake protein [Reichenbachiella]MBU2915472.1 TrkH family potassium uptake protein [Reichenbachiella agariperforans]RJE71460.1 potassium transporter [Reichenbachiella sp. MSK19-1]SHK57307.1 trk system potassium uptake protein TrkH [Reichenbachiella agariperforans]